jgi:hypothetical protein
MSGRQIGTVVGALVVGYLTAGTGLAAYGTAIGGVVGGAIGGALDGPTKTQGPRLDDLKVQFSSYGVGIPTLYGTERISPNVIWSTDKIELPFTSSSGKGGDSTENTNYRYFVHMRQILCATPRDGSTVSIVKILKDGKLIWDASSGIPIGSALASAENLYAGFILYQGHQDQLPNAEEESWTGGPGTASAYRGVVSIYMRAIEAPGGRVPQFSFVLSTTATPTSERLLFGLAAGSSSSDAVIVNGEITQIENYPSSSSGAVRATGIKRGASVSPPSSLTTLATAAVHWNVVPVSGSDAAKAIHPYAGSPGIGSDFSYGLVNFDAGSEIQLITGTTSSPWCVLNPEYAIEDQVSGTYLLKDTAQVILLPAGTVVPLPANPRGVGYYDRFIYVVTFTSSKLQLRKLDSAGTLISTIENPLVMSLGPSVVRVIANASGIYVVSVTADGAGKRPVWKVGTGWTVLSTDTGVTQAAPIYAEADCNDSYCLVGPATNDAAGGQVSYQMVRFNALATSEVKAKDIIADQMERAGETRYDVSALPDSDTVYGYKIAGPASARANIDPILTCFGYYIVDEDGLIKVKRYADITSVATVTFDELGQAEDGGDPADAMPLNRTQEIDLPRSVTVNYIEPTSDFQIASETEVRQVTDSTEDMQIQLSVCVGSDKAKKVAQMALYDQHRRQNQRSTTVSRKFSAVSPGDGVTVEYPRGTWKLWLVLSTNDTGALCEWSLVPGDASIFTHTAIGATGYVPQQVAGLEPSTRTQLIDTAILRDADNSAGPYVAFDSGGSGWTGAELYVGDDDNNLTSRGVVSTNAPIGFAEDVLGTFGSRAVVDCINTMTVSMGDDTLNSITRDVLLSGTSNVAAIGAPGRWELIKFQTADSLGSGRYILSGLIRGMKGTEWACGTHAVGDIFVLMVPSGMLHPTSDAGTVGIPRSYRGVSKGRSVDSIASIVYANTGEGLKPLAPWDARKSVAASNDQTLTWQRRSRLSSNFLRGIVPLGEATESYFIEFYTSSGFTTLAGTLTTNARTLTLTSAQQTAFGLTPGAALNVRIYQLSDTIGRGRPFQGVL